VNVKRLLILSCAMRCLDSARGFLGSLNVRVSSREAVTLMKIATYLNKATIETARMMIMVAPEGVDASAFAAVISQAADEAERLEIAAINVEAALEDGK
jgi:hypothetical protein